MNNNLTRSQSVVQTRSTGLQARASRFLKRLRGRGSRPAKEDRNSENECVRHTRSMDLTHKPSRFTAHSSSTLHVPESQTDDYLHSASHDWPHVAKRVSSPLDMGYAGVNGGVPVSHSHVPPPPPVQNGRHTPPMTLQGGHGLDTLRDDEPRPAAVHEAPAHHRPATENNSLPSAVVVRPSNGEFEDADPRPSSRAGTSEQHSANNKTTMGDHVEWSPIHNGWSTSTNFMSSAQAKRASTSAVVPSASQAPATPPPATPKFVPRRGSASSVSNMPPPSLNRIGSPRLAPTLVMRQLPMPIHNLPMLPPPSPAPLTRTSSRVRLRGVPALPVEGPGDDEVEADHENAGLGDSDDEDNEDNETNESHADVSTAGGDPRQSSESTPSTRSPTPDFRGPPILPAVDVSRLEFSFLEAISEDPRGRAADETVDYFSSRPSGRGSPSLSPTRTLRPSDARRPPFPTALRRATVVQVPNAGMMSPSAPRGSMYRHPSKSMVLLSTPKNGIDNLVSETTSTGKGKAREPPEATQEARSADQPTNLTPPTSPPPLRRMRSMPTYKPSSDPPPYPSFILNHLSKQQVIVPREEEGKEKLPPYSNPIHLMAIMPRKMEFIAPGVQARDRKWRRVLCILEGTVLRVYRCPRSVAGVGLLENWWEKRVGVGDVSVPSRPAFMATGRMSVDKSAPRSTKVDLAADPTMSWPPQPSNPDSAFPGLVPPALNSGSKHNGTAFPSGGSVSTGQPPSSSSSSSSSMPSAPDLSKLDLAKQVPIRSYTMQRAESGLGNDYVKRKNVIRLRLEGEQFLLQAVGVSEVVEWIEGFQAATNIALDLDERPMPRGPLFPRRRRRRARRGEDGVVPRVDERL